MSITASTNHNKVIRLDPRTKTWSSIVSARIDAPPADSDVDSQISLALSGPRDLQALRDATSLMPPLGGMNYEPEALTARAIQRMTRALSFAKKFGSGPFVSVLEIGCGRGENLLGMEAWDTYAYNGIDIDPCRLPGQPTRTQSKSANFHHASVASIPLSDESVDLVASFNVFEHVDELVQGVREVSRVLRTGGVLFSQFGPPWNAPFGPHHNRYSGVPHIHHLFSDDVVSKFSRRSKAYSGLNRRPLEFYRNLFLTDSYLYCAHYIEQATLAHIRFWKHFLPEYQHLNIDERIVNRIDVVLVKK